MQCSFMRRREVVLMALACGLLVVVGGCGSSGPDRVAVSGSVTYQGKPLPDGTVYFVPTGKAGAAGCVAIQDGQYSAKKQDSLLAGDYKVQIEAFRERTLPAQAGAGPGMKATKREQYIPAKYNTSSELKLTIKSGAGSMTQDFDLKD
jgi:hypothetical protein